MPKELRELLRGYSFVKHPYDESQAEIYVCSHPSEPRRYLKIRKDETMRLKAEYDILNWINNRIPSPEPLYYSHEASNEYLLTSEITGTPTYQVEPPERETAVKILAETLRRIHSINPSECPKTHSISNWIETLNEKGVDTSSLGDWRPVEDLVFTHGDYCLPNIIIKDDALSGVIDWDTAGLADLYVDFVSCVWSIRYNYGKDAERLIQVFLETYGVQLDQEKYGFYRRLNDLIP